MQTEDVQKGLADMIGQAIADTPTVKSEKARSVRKIRYERRLAAEKKPYIFQGRMVDIHRRVPSREHPGTDRQLHTVRRGEKLRFDPADGGGERVFHYGQQIYLSDKDLTSLRKAGYSLRAPEEKVEVPVDDYLGSAYMALENDDYHEACRILRDKEAMPHDESGNIVKTKPEVMAALGEWIDDQKG